MLLEEGRSRMPVYDGTLDNLVGYVMAKDLAAMAWERQLIVLDDLVRPVHFVPEAAKAVHVLRELQRRRTQIAVVVDEHGGVAGLLTLEDLVEELVGDIFGETEQPEALVAAASRTATALVRGDAPIREVNRALALDLPEGEGYSTIAGLCIALAGAVPERGARLHARGRDRDRGGRRLAARRAARAAAPAPAGGRRTGEARTRAARLSAPPAAHAASARSSGVSGAQPPARDRVAQRVPRSSRRTAGSGSRARARPCALRDVRVERGRAHELAGHRGPAAARAARASSCAAANAERGGVRDARRRRARRRGRRRARRAPPTRRLWPPRTYISPARPRSSASAWPRATSRTSQNDAPPSTSAGMRRRASATTRRRRAAVHVAGPEHVRRAHDHERQAARGEREPRPLAAQLGDEVRDAERLGVARGRLVARRRRAGAAQRRTWRR